MKWLIAITVPVILFLSTVWAQSTRTQAPVVQQWERDAGARMAFDVASVKRDMLDPNRQSVTSNFPINSGDMYTPNGGFLTATNLPLSGYIAFAYKLGNYQSRLLRSELPKWANIDRYDIQARSAAKNSTKDQMRLMMQSLLGDRFKLMAHFETRQLPVFALVLDKPGKTGPQLQPYPDGFPCDPLAPTATTPTTGPSQMIEGELPVLCGGLVGELTPSGRFHIAVRNATIPLIASWLAPLQNGVDRPILDRTGLSGSYDFSLEFTPQIDGPPPPNFQPDQTGPTFVEALKEQAGLKLVRGDGPVDVLVIDHIEELSPN